MDFAQMPPMLPLCHALAPACAAPLAHLCVQLTKAFKRVLPPDNMKPDGCPLSSLPGNPRMKLHDKMRYLWRGGLRCGGCCGVCTCCCRTRAALFCWLSAK